MKDGEYVIKRETERDSRERRKDSGEIILFVVLNIVITCICRVKYKFGV